MENEAPRQTTRNVGAIVKDALLSGGMLLGSQILWVIALALLAVWMIGALLVMIVWTLVALLAAVVPL